MNIRSMRVPVIVFLAGILVGCEESGKYQPVGADMAVHAIEMLIASGRCPTLDQCRREQLVFARPLNDGVELQIYDSTSIKNIPEIVGKSVEHAYVSQVPHLLIREYRQTRDKANQGLFDFNNSDTIVIDLKVKNAAADR
jgi:hypothetical protein